jgi:hypothetical protein
MSVSTKVLRTFVFAFAGIFLTGLVNILADVSKTGDWSLAKTALVSLILAAVSAAIRAVVAFLPILPDDNVGVQRKP